MYGQGHYGQSAGGLNGGGQHWYMYPGLGKAGFNWFGSAPTIADGQWEPNFRHFDWYMDRNPGNLDLIERIWKVPEGEAHWAHTEIAGGSIKTMPVVMGSTFNAVIIAYLATKAQLRNPHQVRWSFPVCFGFCYFYHNMKAFFSREKLFQRDFQRNQVYAQDEYMRLRKDLRVRQALFELQYVNDPVAEYRLKEFLVSKQSN
jgi:hypothetical protein